MVLQFCLHVCNIQKESFPVWQLSRFSHVHRSIYAVHISHPKLLELERWSFIIEAHLLILVAVHKSTILTNQRRGSAGIGSIIQIPQGLPQFSRLRCTPLKSVQEVAYKELLSLIAISLFCQSGGIQGSLIFLDKL